MAHLTRRFVQSKTEEGRRAAYFERRRLELVEAACPHPGDVTVGPEQDHEPLGEDGHAPPLHHDEVEDKEESYDVLQLRFLVELAHAQGPHPEPAVKRHGSAGCLMLGAPEAPAQPASPDILPVFLEGGGASDCVGSLGVVGDHASQPLLASAQQPTWRQQPALPPRAAARHATPPPRLPAGAQDLRMFPLASFDIICPEASAGTPEPMVTMPFVPAAPDADAQFTTPAASPRGASVSPVRESNAWLEAAAHAGAAAIAAGRGFRTPPRVAWAGSSDDEVEAAQLDATVSLLLEHGSEHDAPCEGQQFIQTDFAAFAAQRRASLRPGDIVSDAGCQRRGDGGLLPADRGTAYNAEYDAVRVQHSYTQHMGSSWPMMVTTQERLEFSFYPAQLDNLACVAEHPPAQIGCRITECDDDADHGLSDLGMLLAERKRDVVGSAAARSFHVPAALLGGAADSEPAGSPVQQLAEAMEAACVLPSQLLSPQLTSPPFLTSAAGDGGGESGAWAAAARITQELTVGPDAAAASAQAPAAAKHTAAVDQPGWALATPAAPVNAAAAAAVAPAAEARETRGVRQLRAALAAQRCESDLPEERQQEEAAEYTAQLESAVLQLLLCKAAAQQFGNDGAAGFGWLHIDTLAAAPQPEVARCSRC